MGKSGCKSVIALTVSALGRGRSFSAAGALRAREPLARSLPHPGVQRQKALHVLNMCSVFGRVC